MDGHTCQRSSISVTTPFPRPTPFPRRRRQRVPGVAVPLDLSFDPPLDLVAIFGCDPAALDQYVGQRGVHVQCPHRAGLGELLLVDQVVLESDDAEEQVAVYVDCWHNRLIGIGGSLAAPPLPHHRAYGSVPRRFDRVKRLAMPPTEEGRLSRSRRWAWLAAP